MGMLASFHVRVREGYGGIQPRELGHDLDTAFKFLNFGPLWLKLWSVYPEQSKRRGRPTRGRPIRGWPARSHQTKGQPTRVNLARLDELSQVSSARLGQVNSAKSGQLDWV